MSAVKTFCFCLFALLSTAQVFGQATRSPFSTFGIGESYGNGLANNQGMGGVGVAQPQYWYANNPNPALLVFNNVTIFQAGLVGEQRKTSTASLSQKATGGNMNYLVTAFPIIPTKWSTSLTLSPYTTVNYRLEYKEPVNNSDEMVTVIEEGEGGVTQFSWANGVRLTKQLAIGLKASYLFGSIINTYKNQLDESNQPANYMAAIKERSYIKDFAFTPGISYSLDSIFHRRQYRLSFGAVYDLATNLKTEQSSIIYKTNSLGDIITPDTLMTSRGNVSLPGGFTGGVSLSRGTKWSIAAEYAYRDWTSFSSVSEDDEGLQEGWKVSMGGEITPDPFGNYFKRMTYRAGFSMEEYPYVANGSKVQDIGINFGFSLPAGRSSIDLAMRVGQRGEHQKNLIEENYFRVYFGITFNDTWFIRRKFD